MMDSLGSHLQVSVEPAQSSFFAGEDFACTITFTNTRAPVPLSAPLPSRATFENATSNSPTVGGQDVQRRIASSTAAFQSKLLADLVAHKRKSSASSTQDQLFDTIGNHAGPSSPPHPAFSASKAKGLHSPVPSISLNPALGRLASHHRKSQSVDIRTYARKQQLEKSNAIEDESATDEHYYRTLSEAAEREEMRYGGADGDADVDIDDEEKMAMLHAQELLASLPARRHRIGKSVKIEPDAPEQQYIEPLPPEESTPAKKHGKANSVAAVGYNLQPPPQPQEQQRLLGIGRPDGAGATAFASPRLPSQRFPLEAISASPQSSRGTSGSIRKTSGPIAKTHPHSRKKSVAQMPAEDLSTTFELDGQTGNVGLSSEDSDLRSSSASQTPRASLDARGRPVENGFYGIGENATMDSVVRDEVTHMSTNQSMRSHKDDHLALPGTETILWAFAHLNGQFVLDESLVKPGEFEHVKQKLAGARVGPLIAGIGGGELGDVTEHDERSTRNKNAGRGWGSYLRGAFSLGGDSAKSAAKGDNLSYRRTGSTLLDAQSKTVASRQVPILTNPPTMLAVDLQLAPGQSKTFSFRAPLPPDIPPSYNGRSISFTYTLTLGTNRLGKGRRGMKEQKSRLARIPMRVYNHIDMSGITAFFDLTNPIVNRKDQSIVTEIEQGNDSKGLFSPVTPSIPMVRTDSNTSVSRRAKKEDNALLEYTNGLLATCSSQNPGEGHTKTGEFDAELSGQFSGASLADSTSPNTSPSSRKKLRSLSSADSGNTRTRNAHMTSHQSRRGQDITEAGLGLHMDDDDLPRSCLQAVEVLSRNSQKVSYDISKDGQVAAVLTLIKSKYRLGDTVIGVVHVNKMNSIARVVRFAASLETHEEIEGTLGTLPAGRAQKLTRVVHAKHDDSTLDAGQACFSLPIPSGATPTFHTSAVRLAWTVRLAFLTLSNVRVPEQSVPAGAPFSDAEICPPPPHLNPSLDDGYGAYHRILHAVPSLAGPWVDTSSSGNAFEREAKLEMVECVVPLSILPHSTRFTVGEVAYSA